MEYNIPLFKLNFDESEVDAVVETIRSKWISTGPKCEEMEKLFSTMLNVKHAISLSNCTDALHLACLVLDIKDGDEVICPSLTFAATANAIKYVRALPVFCDITSIDDLNIDPKKIESLITSKTKAIMVMHFAGFPCDMDAIMNIARKYNLKVIEDACHGPLSEYNGEKLGTIGDIGCFSFFSNKNISTGEGGMVVTNDPKLAERLKLLRSHGMTTMSYERAKGHATSYDIVDLGYNFRMDDIRASIGIAQLKKIRQDLVQRQEIRAKYISQLESIPQIAIPFRNNRFFVSNYIMPIVLNETCEKDRDEVRQLLHSKGIQTSVHYPSVHLFSIYAGTATHLPITEYVSNRVITLPMFGTLTDSEISYICNTLSNALGQ